MRTLFKLILLGALIYGGWYAWKNYDILTWFDNLKKQIQQGRIKEGLSWPERKNAEPKLEAEILIRECQFLPSEKTIIKGTKVIWYNQDNVIRQITGDFSSGIIAPGKSYSRIFSQTGIFNYRCDDEITKKGKLFVN